MANSDAKIDQFTTTSVISELIDETEDCRAVITAQQSTISSQRIEISSLESQVNKKKETVRALTMANKHYRMQLTTTNMDLSVEKKKLHGAKIELATLRSMLTGLINQNVVAHNEIADLNKRLAQAADSLQMGLPADQSAFNKLRTLLGMARHDLLNKIEEVHGKDYEIHEVNKWNHMGIVEAKQLQARNDALQIDVTFAEQTIQQLQDQKNELTFDLESSLRSQRYAFAVIRSHFPNASIIKEFGNKYNVTQIALYPINVEANANNSPSDSSSLSQELSTSSQDFESHSMDIDL